MGDPHKRLGQAVKQRRHDLDLTQRDAAARAAISDQTWLNVEAGRGASELKLAQIERALSWPSGTIDAILAGAEPPEASPTDLSTEVARLRQEIELLRGRIDEMSKRG